MTEGWLDQAKRLQEITGLVPLPLWARLPTGGSEERLEVRPPNDRYARVVGIRLFHAPRDVVIKDVFLSGVNLLRGPVDAAAYALENPMLPLEQPMDSDYRGEALRFVALSWGVFDKHRPLEFYLRPWGTPSHFPTFEGYLVVEFEQRPPWHTMGSQSVDPFFGLGGSAP